MLRSVILSLEFFLPFVIEAPSRSPFSIPLKFFKAEAFLLSVNGIQKTSSLERRRGWHDSQISLSALEETDPLFDLVVSVTESPHSEHWPVAKASKLVRSM